MNIPLAVGALVWMTTVVIVRAVQVTKEHRRLQREYEAARRLLQQERWRVSNLIEQRVYKVYGDKTRHSSHSRKDF